uniref:W2 domain-containing protein n=1 Tax=Megaselia scalaris TaxID=36166 RepID=T1H3P9_MEGSC
ALLDDIHDNKALKDIIVDIKELALKSNIPEHEIISLVNLGHRYVCREWNKKEELVTDQAIKHLRGYCTLLEAFTTTDRSELSLILKVQEFCYENMNFMKAFQKIILLFYKTEVLSEETILRWYKDAHATKGKMHFLEQMKNMVE